MTTSTRLLPLAILCAACAHRADPVPVADPTPTFALSRSLTFAPPTASQVVAYPAAQVSGVAIQSATTLTLQLKAGADLTEVAVPLTALSGQWAGTYALRCPQRPTDPVSVTYVYYISASSWSTSDLSVINNTSPLPLVGDLTITAYDAGRKLLSGHYSLTAGHQLDPTNPTSFEYCDIAFQGAFTDLKIRQ